MPMIGLCYSISAEHVITTVPDACSRHVGIIVASSRLLIHCISEEQSESLLTVQFIHIRRF